MLSGVVLGAFGAHGLKGYLSDYGESIYHTAVFYHFVQALGLLIISSFNTGFGRKRMNIVGTFLLVGALIFSGSLYILALTELKWLGMITPIGGLCMIIGWGLCVIWLPGKCNPDSKNTQSNEV